MRARVLRNDHRLRRHTDCRYRCCQCSRVLMQPFQVLCLLSILTTCKHWQSDNTINASKACPMPDEACVYRLNVMCLHVSTPSVSPLNHLRTGVCWQDRYHINKQAQARRCT